MINIDRLLSDLTPREQEIIKYRYGFIDEQFHSLGETAQKFDVTRETIRRIEARALEKLKEERDFLSFWGTIITTHYWRCLCGKYRTKKYKGIICEKCFIEVQPARHMIACLQDLQKVTKPKEVENLREFLTK